MICGYPALCVASSMSSGNPLTNTTSAASIVGGAGAATIPGGMLQLGSCIRATLMGVISTAAATPGTLTVNIVMGLNIVSGLVATPTLITSASNVSFKIVIDMRVNVMSNAAATAIGYGQFQGPGVFAAAPGCIIVPASGAPPAGSAFDPTISNKVDVIGQWSVASASNSLTTYYSLIELFP